MVYKNKKRVKEIKKESVKRGEKKVKEGEKRAKKK